MGTPTGFPLRGAHLSQVRSHSGSIASLVPILDQKTSPNKLIYCIYMPPDRGQSHEHRESSITQQELLTLWFCMPHRASLFSWMGCPMHWLFLFRRQASRDFERHGLQCGPDARQSQQNRLTFGVPLRYNAPKCTLYSNRYAIWNCRQNSTVLVAIMPSLIACYLLESAADSLRSVEITTASHDTLPNTIPNPL